MKPGVEISGDRQIEKALRRASERMQSQLIKAGMRAAAKPAIKYARREVATHEDAGDRQLVKSIGTRMRTYRHSGVSALVIGPRRGFRNRDNGEEAAKYACAIHWGFNGQTRDPFMQRTMNYMAPHVVDWYQAGMRKRFDKLVSKGAI